MKLMGLEVARPDSDSASDFAMTTSYRIQENGLLTPRSLCDSAKPVMGESTEWRDEPLAWCGGKMRGCHDWIRAGGSAAR